ncbi:xanthine dehydrogenase family protein molybdopterin-binding subunit [Natronomonas salina]|uniref:xanthine dehydrogenase family protein molybdopterin-binding subunit n=1 Tax=Natronomonas salina TaxID=1710540 RepID=UPI0015B75285|nr:xanthine dehydrogenase family protein molybdopterin-binding subunit [Natronomonas salina]QLD89147.1 xanthine dehydrogenase family protein molybdopterin-binding subunit [Natronomonas salina]
MGQQEPVERPADTGQDAPDGPVGEREARVDALGKVTGEMDYTADIPFDDLAHGQLVRSTIAHGYVESIDVDDALEIEGVIDVIFADQIPGEKRIGSIIPDQPLLNDEKVRYLGDPVALVVAENEATARQAADKIVIEYDRLPKALDADEALAEDAEPIHETGNLIDEYGFTRGDPDAAFEDADVTVEESYQSSMIDHVPLEPEASTAKRCYDDTVEVWTSTQHPHGDRQSIARVLDIPERDIEVNRPAVGGGFGSKLEHNQPCYAAVAAWITDRPVRVKYKRDDEFRGTVKRNTLTLDYRIAADKDGKLRAVEADITVDGGSYLSFSSGVAVRSLVHCTGPYYVDAVDASGRAVYTNKPWGGAMRSFDMFQTTFAIESTLDVLAEELGLDPAELRERNAFDGSKPASTTGQEIEAAGLPETIKDVRTALEDIEIEQPEDPAKRRGVGLASMWYGCGETGHHHPSSAFCEIHSDGTATIQCAAAEIGQGSDTALSQIAAETLGLDIDDVKLVTDSTVAPNANETSASRQTFVSGNAVRLATEDALGTILEKAAGIFEEQFDVRVAPADLRATERKIVAPSTDETIPFEEAVLACNNDGLLLTGTASYTPLFDFDIETFRGSPYPTFSFATHGVVVEVDVETGVVEVEQIITSHDVGTAVNPALVEGQIEGGAVMGMGHTLMEEVELDDQGQILNASLMDYHIPQSRQAPDIETHLVESASDEDGPYGAKGVGESALIPIGPAIANAVADATNSRITELPLKPERVVRSLPKDIIYQ